MYILIDRNIMAITHKHTDRRVLAWLSWIECTNVGVTLAIGSVRPLMDFTPLELKTIYKNATGAELKGYGNTLAHAVMAMAQRMEITTCDPAEVEAQAAYIKDGDKSIYSYLPGSKVPQIHAGLFEPKSITVERKEAEELSAASGYNPGSFSPAGGHGFGGTAAPNPFAGGMGAGAATAAHSGPRASNPAQPRAGGTREVIFRVADQMWADAGSPTEKQRVLELRKKMMEVLESDHAVKKTTSSTALGDWQKTRIQ